MSLIGGLIELLPAALAGCAGYAIVRARTGRAPMDAVVLPSAGVVALQSLVFGSPVRFWVI